MPNQKWTKVGICATCIDYKNYSGGALHLWDEHGDTILSCINYK
jgi:hypothetical protein